MRGTADVAAGAGVYGGAGRLEIEQNTERNHGRKAQLDNIQAAKVRAGGSRHMRAARGHGLINNLSHTTAWLPRPCPGLQTVADLIRTCLGPRSMLKMLLDPMGGIVLTNDGNAILRECDVTHPAAKSMIELSRTQDEEVGDGTTSVIILGACAQRASILRFAATARGWAGRALISSRPARPPRDGAWGARVPFWLGSHSG